MVVDDGGSEMRYERGLVHGLVNGLASSARVVAVLWAGLAAGTSAVSGADLAPVAFEEHLMAHQYSYAFGLTATDIDRDGDLDLTSVDIRGKNPSSASLFWYENDGRGAFQRRVIHENEDGWLERHAAGDINGDGRTDIAVVSNRDGLLLWFESPPGPAAGPWTRHVMCSSCPFAYDVVLTDLDADGDLDAASAGYNSHSLAWYENPGAGGSAGEWTRRVIDDRLTENRTVRPVDFNRDGKIDLLIASVGASTQTVNDNDPATHGAVVAWYENSGSPQQGKWTKHVIDDQSRGAIHGHPADVDGDGDPDVVMAFGMRPEHIEESRHQVVWYENLGTPGAGLKWRRHQVGALLCAFEAIAVDLDADGDQDIAATAWSKGDRLVWYENTGDPRGVWTRHLIRENWYAANQVIAADLDGDGLPDLAATADDGSRRVEGANELRWWRNLGQSKVAR